MRIGMLHQTLFWPIVILVSFKFTQKDVHFPRDKRIGMKHSVFLDKTWVSLECLVKCPFIFYLRQVHLNNLSPTSSDSEPIWYRKLELFIIHLKVVIKSIHTERLRHTLLKNLDEAFTTRTTEKKLFAHPIYLEQDTCKIFLYIYSVYQVYWFSKLQNRQLYEFEYVHEILASFQAKHKFVLVKILNHWLY